MKFGALGILFACIFNEGIVSARKEKSDEADSECSECGQANGNSMLLKVNGKKVVPPNKYPWVVALTTMPHKKIFCAGAIINRHFILTSANCVHEKKKLRVGFLTGTDNVGEGVEVEKIISYPGFEPSDFFIDDIALLKLKKPIKCNDFARPVCLPGKNMRIKTSDMFGITRWGSVTGDAKDRTKTLNEARIILASPGKCSRTRTYAKHSHKSHCLKGYKGKSPCLGDYGGSMFKSYKGRHYAIGVSAKIYSPTKMYCDHATGYVIYTSVTAYMPWIQNITGISPTSNKSPK